jgi:nucleotide-binding universal stress UspA family protein
MSIKTILLHFNDVRRTEGLLAAAVQLARSQSAHLIGLSVMPPYVVVPAGDGAGVSITVDEHRAAYRVDAHRMQEQFRAATSDLPLPAEWREDDAGFSSVSTTVLAHARAADLVMAATADPSWGSSWMLEDPVHLVMDSGRPVLIVPTGTRAQVPPQRVTIAYDGRREAARALFDALPLLSGARDVSVVWLDAERGAPGADVPAAAICAALSRHGIKATAVCVPASGGDVGATLLRQAKQDGADLLVMGCYGHSRLREMVLGGASRHVLAHMQLPVLMSH